MPAIVAADLTTFSRREASSLAANPKAPSGDIALEPEDALAAWPHSGLPAEESTAA
jgi:hypothetical protein